MKRIVEIEVPEYCNDCKYKPNNKYESCKISGNFIFRVSDSLISNKEILNKILCSILIPYINRKIIDTEDYVKIDNLYKEFYYIKPTCNFTEK